MDWDRFVAALIRAFWSVVFPLIGAGVAWLANPGNLEEVGVTNGTVAIVVGGILYGLKKAIWPDTKL